jgi:Tol biopolymer transport system component
MKVVAVIVWFLISLVTIQCVMNKESAAVSYSYPGPRPDSSALPFLPGVVCTDSLDFNAAFSPDGKSFYFARSKNGKWKIFVTSFDGEQWAPAKLVSFSEDQYSEADPFIKEDGTLFYISDRPRNTADSTRDFDIWFVRPVAGGGWSVPENVEGVNTDSTEYYVSLAGNGNLYFASNREGGFGDHDIYVSKWMEGKYQPPVNLGPAINSIKMEHDPSISPDERFLIFTSVERDDTFGEADLYYSTHTQKGWSPARNMGPRINTPTYEYCSFQTRDGKYFFYSTGFDVKWIDTRFLPAEIRSE